jgi:hypothetical protein
MEYYRTIPSEINTSAAIAGTPAASQPWEQGTLPRDTQYVYITAILKSTNITINTTALTSIGPVSFPSPIQCTGFAGATVGAVAYFKAS